MPPTGPSTAELRLRAERRVVRRELDKLKKAGAAGAGPNAGAAGAGPNAGSDAAACVAAEVTALRAQLEELTSTKGRLSKLYFSQLEENRRRARRLHQILESIGQINSDLDLDRLLDRIVESIRVSLGFGVVLLRIREPGSVRLKARAFAGVSEEGRAALSGKDVEVKEFESWLHDEFKVSRSYFISHNHAFSKLLPEGYKPDLGRREDWEWHPDDVLFSPLYDRAGELMGYLSVDDPADRLVPSTETIELLEIFGNHAVVAIENARLYGELERQTCELREAGQRMQEMHALKSQFVSTVSHELRTPLTAIRAYLDTLLSAGEDGLPAARLQQFLAVVNDESRRLERLIESVLDLNRFDSGMVRLERRPLDLAQVVRETVGLLEPLAEAGQVTLKAESTCADTRVDADPDQMRQLVLHLGSNAVKFTPPGGLVTILLLGTPNEITLQVEDTGIGIPEEALGRVFERFYQVDATLARRYGGAGLGLAICKSIVEWHGGTVNVQSSPGSGSCFRVALPRRPGPRVVFHADPDADRAAEDVLRLAIEMVAEVMDARIVSLLASGPGGDLVVRAALGLEERVLREARVEPGRGVAGWVAEHRRPVCVSNALEEGELAGSGRARYRSRTFLSVPLEGASGLLGVLNVTDPVSQGPFEAEDCHLLLQLAERVAAAWEQARAADAPEGAAAAARMLRESLQGLTRGRGDPSVRVRLARATARELGLGPSDVALISYAASMEAGADGMAGELAEAAALEREARADADPMRRLETLGAVRELTRARHEWWDGTGYPCGLRGGEIPAGAGVLAVVDAWESMTAGKAGTPARSQEDALIEIRSLAGRRFDPRVVEGFERALSAPEARRGAAPAATDSASAIARR